jgi:hypothetical protein
MTLYYAQGGNKVVAIHTDDQIALDPPENYGFGTYVIVDYYGKAPPFDASKPGYTYPTITTQMQADSTKLECQRRIKKQMSDNTQRNINAYMSDLEGKVALGQTLTAAEQSDLQTSLSIHGWINRPAGMLGACDSLIAANDQQWWLDGKWPAWNSAWNSFTSRF